MLIKALTGSEAFLRQREYRRIIRETTKSGVMVELLDGTDPGGIISSLESRGVFFAEEPTLFVINTPDKLDVGVFRSLEAREDATVTVLIHYDGDPKGNTKFGKYIGEFPSATPKDWGKPKKAHLSLTPPEKEFQKADWAAAFCVAEASGRGCTFSHEELPVQLVARVGPNLGVLSFEILKASLIVSPEDHKITPEILKGVLASMHGDGEVLGLAMALMTRDSSKVVRALIRVRAKTKEDPTIAVCQQLWGLMSGWVEVAAQRDSGKGPDEIAELTGKNPWFVRNKLLPQVQRWPLMDLLKLVRVLSESQALQRQGVLSPWRCFMARVLGLIA